MAEKAKWSDVFKRWAWLWPLVVGVVTLVGFRFISPNSRLDALEAQVHGVPAATRAAIDSQIAPLREEVAAQRVRDSIIQAQLDEMRAVQQTQGRQVTVGLLLQCRALPERDADFLRQLAIACDQTSQRTGIPYRRP